MMGCLMVLILLFNEGIGSGAAEFKLIDETVLIQQRGAANNSVVENKVKLEKFSGKEREFEIPRKCQEFFTQRCKVSLPDKSVDENTNNFEAMKARFVSCCKAADHQEMMCNSLMEEFPVDKKNLGTQVVENLCVAMEEMAKAHDAWLRAEKTKTSLMETSLDHTVKKKDEEWNWKEIKIPKNGKWYYYRQCSQLLGCSCCHISADKWKDGLNLCKSGGAGTGWKKCPSCKQICEDEGKGFRTGGTAPQCRAGDRDNKKGWCPGNYEPYAISGEFTEDHSCDAGLKACCCA